MLATDRPQSTNQARSGGQLTIGVVVAERLYAGQIQDGSLNGDVRMFPLSATQGDPEDDSSLVEYHTDALVEAICDLTLKTADGQNFQCDRGGHRDPRPGTKRGCRGCPKSAAIERCPSGRDLVPRLFCAWPEGARHSTQRCGCHGRRAGSNA